MQIVEPQLARSEKIRDQVIITQVVVRRIVKIFGAGRVVGLVEHRFNKCRALESARRPVSLVDAPSPNIWDLCTLSHRYSAVALLDRRSAALSAGAPIPFRQLRRSRPIDRKG